MARKPRFTLPCVPQHVIQRGHNREPCFYSAWGEAGWMVPHEEYLSLDADTSGRCAAYRELFRLQVPEDDIQMIRKSITYCQPLGDDRFRRQIEAKYGVRLGYMRRGRPKSDEALVTK